MLCAIYKSSKKEGAYLYLTGRDKFDPVPAALKTLLGSLSLALIIDLNRKESLSNVDIAIVKKDLISLGYFLQLPPPPIDHLALNKELKQKMGMKMTKTDFWKTKTLAQLSQQEWESLCDGCGKCCLAKLIDDDAELDIEGRDEIHFTNVACYLLNQKSCQCNKYEQRFDLVEDCVKVTLDDIEQFHWLPSSCAYRLLIEGKDLPSWHPLISGSKSEMHKKGMSIRGKVINEVAAGDLEDHIVTWPLDYLK